MSTATVPTVRPNVTPESRQKALQEELRELVDLVGPAPLVDLLLERAFQLRATDIHLDPCKTGLRVRLRVDGLLHDVLQLPPEMMSQVVSRVKLMSGMDITERRFAQDGHISSAVLKHQRDVRVGSGPTIFGERLVLRLMPDTSTFNRLEELGLEESQIALIKRALRMPHGMLLSVGPVGSGKSTTMYSCLEILNQTSDSLVTIEDPVERRIEGVNQIQVEPKIEFNFVEALRGVLRQDPNVIMVGEIRDPETAHIAVRAGLTGVLVLSTLHANDTASTVDVFREFSIPPMFIADSLNCVLSQRLVRKTCQTSFEEYSPDAAECSILGFSPEEAATLKLKRGIPSEANFHTGYLGRTGVFEVMPVDADVRMSILGGRSASELRQLVIDRGMQTLDQAAIRKVRAGITTLEEMHRVLMMT
jgi:type II secretory ATPase GspE/PulE/Tfp pilus assembly ATPase PilB-like protein